MHILGDDESDEENRLGEEGDAQSTQTKTTAVTMTIQNKEWRRRTYPVH